MKKLLITLLGILSVGFIHAQNSCNTVYDSKSLFFYGFDYSGLRIADATRIGQNIMPFFPATAKLMEKRHDQKNMEVRLRKAKGAVTYNTAPATSRNEKINNGKVVAEDPRKLTPDSLSAMVKRYELTEKEGIGYTVIFECFNREEQTISAYMVFFDIATRDVICTKSVVSHDANGYNYMGDWKKASIVAMERLMDVYVKDAAAYRKEQKKAGE
jgi:hypothetical protein